MVCNVGEVATELGCVPSDPMRFAQFIYNFGLGLVGVVSFMFLLYGSYVLTVSRARPEEVNKGKDYIHYSIVGLVFAVLGILFVKIVIVQILQIPGFQ